MEAATTIHGGQWNGNARFGYKEGVTKEHQKMGSRARLLKMAEDGVPFDERKFGMDRVSALSSSTSYALSASSSRMSR